MTNPKVRGRLRDNRQKWEGKMEGTRKRRRCKQLLDDFKEKRSHGIWKRKH